MNKNLLSLIFALICIFAESVNTYTVLTSNKIGTIDGLSYELWKDRGDTYMTLYTPDKKLLELVRTLASGEGLFVWKEK